MARPRKKGYRQGYLKRFHGEYINAGQRFSPKDAATEYAVFSGKDRAESIRQAPAHSNYETNQEHYKQAPIQYLDPLDVVTQKLKHLWQGDFWQGVTRFHRVNIIIDKVSGRNLFLFFSGQCFFFVAEYPDRNIVKRSVVYTSREQAMLHMENARIYWVEPRDLVVPLLDGLPPR